MEYSREEALRLMAQGLRAARGDLGITAYQAAKRAGLSAEYYRKLEKGLVPGSVYVLRKLVSVCRSLDVESIRINYVEEIEQHVNLDLSSDPPSGRMTVFLDSLEADVAKLEEIECFVSPDIVLGFLERVGFNATLASKKSADKQMVELLSAAVFSMCLDQDKDYYVKPVKDDPPDVELLVVDRDSCECTVVRLEITQHGKYSESLFEVIGKKLAKRYHKGTILVVMVEKSERLIIAELYEFVRKNNPYGQQIIIIGGTSRAGQFLAVLWDEVSSSSAEKAEYMEIEIHQGERSTGFRGYQGVFYEPSWRWRLRGIPLFVKEVVMHG